MHFEGILGSMGRVGESAVLADTLRASGTYLQLRFCIFREMFGSLLRPSSTVSSLGSTLLVWKGVLFMAGCASQRADFKARVLAFQSRSRTV